MITKEVIRTLYKQYPKRPKSVDCLDVALLFDSVGVMHDVSIDIDSNDLLIGSIDARSLFHRIPLAHIHAIVPFEEWTAIVLHSSIIFLNKKSTKVSVHLKPPTSSLTERIKDIFSK
ncbi:MAG: hypothetical protein Q4C34_00655 [Bacteroidales bacterium]|nr:hypothetical protein [Bacteroidales bacterium]